MKAARLERDIQHEIRLASALVPELTLWRNSTGVAERAGRTLRYGLQRGSSDLIGVLAPTGRLVALECKTDVGRLTEEQRLFLAHVRSRGGFAAVVRSVSEFLEAMKRAKEGKSE
jgi:hypothetical protein